MNSGSVRYSLSLAACSLLNMTAESQAASSSNTTIDTAVMYYGESEGRVSLIEPVIRLKTEINEDEFLDMQLVLDALTGASPNGAQPSTIAQTFTSPSGNEDYTVPAGDLPLDTSFRDTRATFTASLDSPIDRLTRKIYSATLSYETDWISLAGSATFSRDYNQRHTTLTGGAGLTFDSISPTGGTPVPLAEMVNSSSTQPKDGDESRTSIDLMIGVTQVINRSTLMQLNYSIAGSNGYHSDPYKIVSIIDNNSSSGTYGIPTDVHLYESRPDSRLRQNIYWKTVQHFDEDILHVAYRYYFDDWNVNSHTIDLKYRYRLTDKSYLLPHLRYYTQSAANFYTHSLYESDYLGSSLPDYASADSRLAEFSGTTIGIKYGYKLKQGSEWSMRLEQISQRGDSTPANAIGEQQNQDLYPDLTAIVLQVNYSMIW